MSENALTISKPIITHESLLVGRGTRFWWHGTEAKVMAVADGYAMARKKGAVPFVVSVEEVRVLRVENQK